MTTQRQYLAIACIVLAAFGICTTSAGECFDFNSDPTTAGWTNTGAIPWLWSGRYSPITAYVPNFTPSPRGYYMFLQDIGESFPLTGSLRSGTFTLTPTSTVKISIYRHLVNTDIDDNPILNFVISGVPHPLVWSYNTDIWDALTYTCGSPTPCCTAPSCTGHFTIDGTIYAKEEILGVDSISVDQIVCDP